jgi:hypothetical protein
MTENQFRTRQVDNGVEDERQTRSITGAFATQGIASCSAKRHTAAHPTAPH